MPGWTKACGVKVAQQLLAFSCCLSVYPEGCQLEGREVQLDLAGIKFYASMEA